MLHLYDSTAVLLLFHCVSGFRYGCPLLFVVGIDDENRSCVLGQGLLRSECTETFEWFLNKYESAAGGRKPKVIPFLDIPRTT